METEPEHVIRWRDQSSGLNAVLVIDSMALGPGAGGIRTLSYDSDAQAEADARGLARAMTIKCALANLSAGGAKAVVKVEEGFDRSRAFEVLGQRIQSLGGLFRTAGDLGTTASDLACVKKHTEYVHTDEPSLADSVSVGHLATLRAALLHRGLPSTGLRVAIQGLGAIGSAIATRLHHEGFELWVADPVDARTEWARETLGAHVVAPDDLLMSDVDILAPCAMGGVIDAVVAKRLTPKIVCGGANRILTEGAGDILMQRGVLFVPDVLSSAGAVADGIGRTVMGLSDRRDLIEGLGTTAEKVFALGDRNGIATSDAALQLADSRIRMVSSEHRQHLS